MTKTAKRAVDPTDILDRAEYLPRRVADRKHMTEVKRHRRVEVGPFAAFYFENYETVRHQIQEMLYIEKGGAEQLAGEIEAYGPLIPQGNELVATVMFEIDEPARRAVALVRIGGIENHTFIRVGDEISRGLPDPDRENTSPEGKASSVQFFHFPLTETQVAGFRDPKTPVQIGFDHPNYGHIALVNDAVRAALIGDL